MEEHWLPLMTGGKCLIPPMKRAESLIGVSYRKAQSSRGSSLSNQKAKRAIHTVRRMRMQCQCPRHSGSGRYEMKAHRALTKVVEQSRFFFTQQPVYGARRLKSVDGIKWARSKPKVYRGRYVCVYLCVYVWSSHIAEYRSTL